jgi:hypothetical protein
LPSSTRRSARTRSPSPRTSSAASERRSVRVPP